MDTRRQPQGSPSKYELWKNPCHNESREQEIYHSDERDRGSASEDRSGEFVTGNDGQALIPTGVTLHSSELFTDRVTMSNVEEDRSPIPTSSSPSGPTLVQIQLKFEDIQYKVTLGNRRSPSSIFNKCKKTRLDQQRQPGAEKVVLNGVSGSLLPGEILALMGPSGSGKTSLLTIIGGRSRGKVSGRVTYNGAVYTSALKSRIGFVTQDDILFPVLTVRETLVFAALLRLKMSHREKISRAETVLRELGLERCQNTIVGGPFVRGVSGGERKRTSIGYEILVDPSLLLLDEPTSGLDSSTALKILQVLRANAQVGRVIVTTIHQPSSRMYYMFDKLILLSEGQPLYFGPARDAVDYFASLHFEPLLPMNPADFLIDLATGITSDMTVPPELTKKNLLSDHSPRTEPDSQQKTETKIDLGEEEDQRQLVLKLLRSKYRSNLEGTVKEKLRADDVVPSELKAAILVKKSWTSSLLFQFVTLSRRNSKARRKDYLNVLRLGQGIAVALLLCMLWWRSELETEQDIRDQVGLLFYITIFWCTFSMWSTMMVFPMEKNYLSKERAADMYRLSAYFLSSTFCDLLAELVHPTIFMPLVYFTVGLKGDVSAFILTMLSIYLIVVTAQAFGEFFGAVTLNFKTVGIASAMIMLIFLLAGGYYVKNIPVFVGWVRYVSLVYYGFRLLEKVQYSPNQTYNCRGSGGCIRFEECPVFSDLSLDGGFSDALALIIMIVVYKVLAYIFLLRV
ncbi:hypothetical protein R1sor_007318 [Riccia sorocarpa]|uniref:ABC transporter domain-containing protein n=1 Tax=Riccia sorocarpa TaxID=122646 RepID=A0ABD3HT17_9MARC